MAWLNKDDTFDPDSFHNKVLGIAAELGVHDSGVHQHAMGQLLFTHWGCIRITLAEAICLLPPTRIAWIPPELPHRAEVTGAVGYRSVYLDTAAIPDLPETVEVLEASPLLQTVLERIAMADFSTQWEQGPPANLLAVCLDELHQARSEPTVLPLPRDPRLRHLASQASHTLPPSLKLLADHTGASEKTISRIMRRETGMSYQQWRQQWRLIKAIEMLAEQNSLTTIAAALDFSSDSAFSTFFKSMTGLPPREYMADSGSRTAQR